MARVDEHDNVHLNVDEAVAMFTAVARCVGPLPPPPIKNDEHKALPSAWSWAEVRNAINDSDRQFVAFLTRLPRSEIERLIYSNDHWCNVVGNFDITNGDAATAIYDEIIDRARCAFCGRKLTWWQEVIARVFGCGWYCIK